MIFSSHDYYVLHRLFELDGYAGYKPYVRELPNGDGKVDAGKRYLHVALKYDPPAWAVQYLARAHFEACRIAEALRVPAEFYPRVEDGTLRVLEYPAGRMCRCMGLATAPVCPDCGGTSRKTDGIVGAGSAEHTDFDLFTVHCYRSGPGVCWDGQQPRCVRYGADQVPYNLGEIGELIGLGKAPLHRVVPRSEVQHSIVYFAMPSHAARLFGYGDGRHATVGEWLKGRIARSRSYT